MTDDARLHVSADTRDAVNARKRGDDTQDDVVQRLLDDGNGESGGYGVIRPSAEPDATSEASVSIQPELDEDAVDEMVERLEARLSDVDAGGVDAEAIAAEIIDQMPALTYDDAVAANRKALREELPDGVFKR